MKKHQLFGKLGRKTLAAAGLAGALIIGGCSGPNYPESKAAVVGALSQNRLEAVHVSQDRNRGVIILTGTVPNENQKTMAASIAREAAATYTIVDKIEVVTPPSSANFANSGTDSAIENNFNAELKKNRNLAEQNIAAKSTNGAVILTGSVKTEAQKREAYQIAKHVPNVEQVVNELTVEPKKHSSGM